MAKDLLEIVERLANERNIAPSVLFEGIEASLVSAAKRLLGAEVDVTRASINRLTGEFSVYATKAVVEDVTDENLEISLGEALLDNPAAKIGDRVEIEVTPHDFGRIASQSAKQVITQRIREAEREMVFEQYVNRAGDLVTGSVQRYERGNVIIDLGVTEAILPYSEQAFGERYRQGERVKCLITEVNRGSKESQVVLSRRNPDLVRRLFEKEVAEIHDGTVIIRTIAREAGRRTKLAVYSIRSDVDPVGACVGMKGSRVQMVVQELRGERIDIIEYSNDRRKYVANSLKPAHVDPESVELDEDTGRATVVVPDDQLYLAIGKNGLNAKLASQMTGIEIDIVSESEVRASEEVVRNTLLTIPEINAELVEPLMALGVFSYESIVDAGPEVLCSVPGIDQDKAAQIVAKAKEFVANPPIEVTPRRRVKVKLEAAEPSGKPDEPASPNLELEEDGGDEPKGEGMPEVEAQPALDPAVDPAVQDETQATG